MQQIAETETTVRLNALQELYTLLSSPGAIEANALAVQLAEKGYPAAEIEMMLQIGTELTAAKQKLAAYDDVQNKRLMEKNFQITLDGLDDVKQSAKNTMALAEQLKTALITNATGTLTAFNRVVIMYTIAFVIGVLLIVTAVVFGAMGKTVLAIAFGTLGIIDIVTYFVKLPANKIQESRSNLSQLQVVLLVWLKEFVNNDVLCARVLNGPNPSLEQYKILSGISVENTASLLKLIEDMAEPKS